MYLSIHWAGTTSLLLALFRFNLRKVYTEYRASLEDLVGMVFPGCLLDSETCDCTRGFDRTQSSNMDSPERLATLRAAHIREAMSMYEGRCATP